MGDLGNWFFVGVRGIMVCAGFVCAGGCAMLALYLIGGFAKGIAKLFKDGDNDEE